MADIRSFFNKTSASSPSVNKNKVLFHDKINSLICFLFVFQFLSEYENMLTMKMLTMTNLLSKLNQNQRKPYRKQLMKILQ